jgi:hypothetical protein
MFIILDPATIYNPCPSTWGLFETGPLDLTIYLLVTGYYVTPVTIYNSCASSRLLYDILSLFKIPVLVHGYYMISCHCLKFLC